MRLWSLHPRYLDTKGLCAAWREALLAQKVLQGETKGYRRHPQLARFQAHAEPLAAIAAFLRQIQAEGAVRGYRFDAGKILETRPAGLIEVTEGQLLYEWRHLQSKLEQRDPARYAAQQSIQRPEPHPLFRVVPGELEAWEIKSE